MSCPVLPAAAPLQPAEALPAGPGGQGRVEEAGACSAPRRPPMGRGQPQLVLRMGPSLSLWHNCGLSNPWGAPFASTAHLHAAQCLQSQLLGVGRAAGQHCQQAAVHLVLVLGVAAAQRVQQNLHLIPNLCRAAGGQQLSKGLHACMEKKVLSCMPAAVLRIPLLLHLSWRKL